ncbi:MAG: type II secretion system protein [Micrococcales bacterium]
MKAIQKQLAAKSDKGFTLIELLVVVLILGILSVIAVVAVNNARATAVVKACKTDAVSVVKALDNYYLDKGSYPVGGGTLTAGDMEVLKTYLHTIPHVVGDDAGFEYYLSVSTTASEISSVFGTTDPAGNNPLPGCDALQNR